MPSKRLRAPHGFIIVWKDGETGAITLARPTKTDLEFADSGLTELIRIADMTRYHGGHWLPLDRGKLSRADLREFPDAGRFHISPARGAAAG